MTSDSSYQQSWHSDGQVLSHDPPNQLKTETKNIMTFHMELSADMYQHWNASSYGSPSVLQAPLINPVQESYNHCDIDMSNTYQTGIVSDEELFVISSTNWT